MTHNDADQPINLPDELQARLDAAGVTDQAGLEAALEADPDLKRDYLAFLEQHPELLHQAIMQHLLAAFLDVADANALAQFWQQVPLELEEPFLAAVAQAIAQAEQSPEEDAPQLAEGLRKRRDGLHQLRAQQAELVAQVTQWATALAAAPDAGIGPVWNDIPLELEDAVLALVEQQADTADQSGDSTQAHALRTRVAALRQVQTARRDLADQPPVVRALLAFLQAESDDDARRVYAAQRELLQPYEAQRMLDELVGAASAELQARFQSRSDLLRTLRGAAPVVAPPTMTTVDAAMTEEVSSRSGFVNQNVSPTGDLNQAGGNIYINSAHVPGSGSAVVINNVYLERRWTRPTPPLLPREMIARTNDLHQVKTLLEQQDIVAISGQTSRMITGATTTTVQGMPGIGKTTLANQIALELDQHYPDGVIWQPVGPAIRSPDQVQPILNAWAQYALLVPPDQGTALQFEPGAVRALLSEHPRLLVILDNVWDLAAIRPLRDALPPGARLIVTTPIPTGHPHRNSRPGSPLQRNRGSQPNDPHCRTQYRTALCSIAQHRADRQRNHSATR
jgi:hypothetical protein